MNENMQDTMKEEADKLFSNKEPTIFDKISNKLDRIIELLEKIERR